MTGESAALPRTIFAAVLGAVALGFAAPALAGPESLRDGLFGARPSDGRNAAAPPIARYVSEDGDIFVLDRSQPKPLLKFEASPEVWALQPQPAPRGDMIYKNDLGEPVLRATRLGGVTVFTDQRPGGSAAALVGGGNPLRLSPLGPQALLERLAQASARASRAARRLIPFEALEATPASASLIGDAAMITSEAVVRMSHRPDGRSLLSRFAGVRFVEGRKPQAQVRQGTLQITVAPSQGMAGRPSSERIVAAAATIH